MSATTLAVLVAVIGLVGALIGAAAGLAGNQMALRHQTERQERNFRRQVYSDFLETVRNGHSAVLRNDAINSVFDAGNIMTALNAGLLETSPLTDSANKLDAVAAQIHRLHLAADPLVYEAASEIYQALGDGNLVSRADDPELHLEIDRQFYTAIGIFTDAARADTGASGRKRTSAYAKHIEELQRDGKIIRQRTQQHREARRAQHPKIASDASPESRPTTTT